MQADDWAVDDLLLWPSAYPEGHFDPAAAFTRWKASLHRSSIEAHQPSLQRIHCHGQYDGHLATSGTKNISQVLPSPNIAFTIQLVGYMLQF